MAFLGILMHLLKTNIPPACQECCPWCMCKVCSSLGQKWGNERAITGIKIILTCSFPFLSSNIPSGPSYGVYISQLIRYARCCSHYDDFRYRHKCLVDRLLSQGYKALRLEKSFKKFYGRYQDLIEKYQRSVNAMVSDSFPGQFLFNM